MCADEVDNKMCFNRVAFAVGLVAMLGGLVATSIASGIMAKRLMVKNDVLNKLQA
jgi:hypothetical protein